MIASDLRNLATMLDDRAKAFIVSTGAQIPLAPSEMRAMAAHLRSLANRAEALENLPVPRARRWPVIDGGGGSAA